MSEYSFQCRSPEGSDPAKPAQQKQAAIATGHGQKAGSRFGEVCSCCYLSLLPCLQISRNLGSTLKPSPVPSVPSPKAQSSSSQSVGRSVGQEWRQGGGLVVPTFLSFPRLKQNRFWQQREETHHVTRQGFVTIRQ